MELNIITNQIAIDYLSFTGRDIQHKNLITPQEYLMFREQAIKELQSGIVSNIPSTNASAPIVQNRETEPVRQPTQNNSENAQKKEEVPQSKITSFAPKSELTEIKKETFTNKSSSQKEELLELMKAFKD